MKDFDDEAENDMGTADIKDIDGYSTSSDEEEVGNGSY